MLYELKFFGRYYGQRTIYTFNYVADTIATGVLGAFGLVYATGAIIDSVHTSFDGLFLALLDTHSQQWTCDRIVARAPRDYDVTDFYEYVFTSPEPGNITSTDTASPQAAYGLVTNRVRLDIKPGSKRLAGVAQNLVDAGGVLSSTITTPLADLCELLTEPLEYVATGGTTTYHNCVVGKEMYTEPPAKKAYRYYATLSEQLDHIARDVTWSLNPNETTQNSRKYGRGV